jgi:hypothetical protein
LFNLAIDSKLRGCGLVGLHVGDIASGSRALPRTITMQQKTHWPVQFEIAEQTQTSFSAWIEKAHLAAGEYLFPSRVMTSSHITARQYVRIVAETAGSCRSAVPNAIM